MIEVVVVEVEVVIGIIYQYFLDKIVLIKVFIENWYRDWLIDLVGVSFLEGIDKIVVWY